MRDDLGMATADLSPLLRRREIEVRAPLSTRGELLPSEPEHLPSEPEHLPSEPEHLPCRHVPLVRCPGELLITASWRPEGESPHRPSPGLMSQHHASHHAASPSAPHRGTDSTPNGTAAAEAGGRGVLRVHLARFAPSRHTVPSSDGSQHRGVRVSVTGAPLFTPLFTPRVGYRCT